MLNTSEFELVKVAAKTVWAQGYSDKHGYVSEKLRKIDSVSIKEWWIIPNMFDIHNTIKFLNQIENKELSTKISKYLLNYYL